MAFNAQQISPIDFNKSAAVGIDIPFTGPGGVASTPTSGSLVLPPNTSNIKTPFRPNYTTKEAIKNNLFNYFLTNPGERPLNPRFGGGLRAFIFEQINKGNLNFLKEKIQRDLDLLFSNVIVNNLEVNGQEDTNSINVSLSYSIENSNINDNITMNFT